MEKTLNELERALLDAAEDSGGPERIWQVPESAAVRFGDSRYPAHPFDGATVTSWCHA